MPKCFHKKIKNFTVTILELFFWYPHANFQLWSQNTFFHKVFWKIDFGHLFLSILKFQKNFPNDIFDNFLHM